MELYGTHSVSQWSVLVDGELELRLFVVETFHQQRREVKWDKARSRNLRVRHWSTNYVQGRVNDLFSKGVVSASVVIDSTILNSDQLATSLEKIEFYFGSVTGTRSHADHFGTKKFEKKIIFTRDIALWKFQKSSFVMSPVTRSQGQNTRHCVDTVRTVSLM